MSETNDKKHQVLMDWKKSYLESLIDKLHPFGDVLEVGYGSGDAAARIQTYKPKSHTIIEADPQVSEKAKAWGTGSVKVIQGLWQNILPQLGVFDVIFFNDYPLESGLEIMVQVHLSPEESVALSNNIKIVLAELEEKMSQIKVQFSDREIDDFYQKIGQFRQKELPNFFDNLEARGHITKKQHTNAIKKYHLKETSTNSIQNDAKTADPMFQFLEECVANHMREGSLFSSFLPNPTSKYEDPLFFDRIITNPALDYKESLISIKIPGGKPKEALLFVVKKF